MTRYIKVLNNNISLHIVLYITLILTLNEKINDN